MKPVQKAVSKPKLLNKKQSKPLVENRKRAQGVGITVPSPSISFKTLSRSKINKSEWNFDDDQPLPISSEEQKTNVLETVNPENENKLVISMKLALNYLQLKSSILQEIPCALTLESLEQEESKQVRSGIDVICVIDVSGSMQGPKLELAKKTLKFMTTQLGPNDRACVVTFSDEAQRLCPLACMNDLGKQILDERIDNINIEGGTEIVLGLDCALQILSMRRHHNSVTSIILLSDGVDNNTSTAMNRFRASIIKSDLGILTSYSIHTFGYGKDHDANIMNAMAQVKNGGFYYVEKEDSIPQAFANCLGELMSVFADSINVILRTEAVDVPFSLTKIYSETGDSSFRMPPVLSGSKKEAIFLLCFPPCDLRVPDNHKIQPIRAFVSYKNPRSNEEFKDECLLTIDVYNEEFLIDDIKVDEDVIVNFYRVKSADVLKQAGEFGDQGLMQEARNLLAQTAQELRNSVVADNELIKILIQDLESSVDRFENRATWNRGGQAELKSKANNHWSKRGPTNAMYQNRAQKTMSKKTEAYFGE